LHCTTQALFVALRQPLQSRLQAAPRQAAAVWARGQSIQKGWDVKARVKWIEGMSFLGESGSGHALVMDGAPDIGGRNLGPRPMELLLIGTGGCSAIDVVMILQKARQDVVDCVVDIEAERAETDPKVFTRMVLRYRVVGRGLNRKQVERAIALSKEKYCSASIMLAKTASIETEIELIDLDAAAASA
jgi:putative redox protein